jgi:hypothetical protein
MHVASDSPNTKLLKIRRESILGGEKKSYKSSPMVGETRKDWDRSALVPVLKLIMTVHVQ